LLQKVAIGTNILRDTGEAKTHAAAGRGPFGKLTQLGLQSCATAWHNKLVEDVEWQDASGSYVHISQAKHGF
jgi:hypothetical protein